MKILQQISHRFAVLLARAGAGPCPGGYHREGEEDGPEVGVGRRVSTVDIKQKHFIFSALDFFIQALSTMRGEGAGIAVPIHDPEMVRDSRRPTGWPAGACATMLGWHPACACQSASRPPVHFAATARRQYSGQLERVLRSDQPRPRENGRRGPRPLFIHPKSRPPEPNRAPLAQNA